MSRGSCSIQPEFRVKVALGDEPAMQTAASSDHCISKPILLFKVDMAPPSQSSDRLEKQIVDEFREVFEAQNPGKTAPQLDRETVLLDTGLDSLGFAILVVGLEETLGYDPFVEAEDAFFPQTFGEFIDYYRKNSPARA